VTVLVGSEQVEVASGDLSAGSVGTALIDVRGLRRGFRNQEALRGVELTVPAGRIHALLGPNGAGKTTLIRILAGLVDPDAGDVSVAGPVGLIPSGDRSFYLRLSGLENLLFFARLQGLRPRAARERARELLGDVGLDHASRLPVGRYSHGMQKRLSVARALVRDPAVLLVDEATHDLDPEGAQAVRALIADVAAAGAAVLWATQRIEEIRGHAQTVTLLQEGLVRFSGSVAELGEMGIGSRYVLRIADSDRGWPPSLEDVRGAVHTLATVDPFPGMSDQFTMTPRARFSLGNVIVALADSGLEVLSCRPEVAELEQAFIAVTGGAL
jgi:ABC-2 type transport system ATP-binding protein